MVPPTLDPEALAQDFLALLGQDLPEQRYQEFLESNTALIPREFVQNHGVHLQLVLRKLRLGADFVTDFFLLSKSSADWNCVAIELEKPQSRYFRGTTGTDLHSDFNKALEQIHQWKSWFLNPVNLAHFTDHILGPLRVPLSYNRCYMKYVLVMGRRSEFGSDQNRKNTIASREAEDLKIMTYDSLAEDLVSKGPLYVGIRNNDHFHIASPEYVSEFLFHWVETSQLTISQALKDDIEANRHRWRVYSTGTSLSNAQLSLDSRLPQIKVV